MNSDRCVERLAEAWRVGVLLPPLPARERPGTLAEAYKVQAALAVELDFPVGGWKIGCTSKAAQTMLGARGPFAAPIFAPRIFEAPVTLPAFAGQFCGLEAEFAFRFKTALPARRAAYDQDEVEAAIGAAHIAVEIVNSRFADGFKVGVASIVADMGGHGYLALGPAIARWRQRDLARAAAQMTVNGKVVGEGTGAAVMGGPLIALTWLANHARRRGGIATGQIVTTGTCTGLQPASPGDRAEARFGPFGSVAIAFSGP